MSLAVHWCFTWNASDSEADSWSHATEAPIELYDAGTMVYMVYQVEKGTHVHLQGFLSLQKKQRLRQVEKLLGGHVHLEKTRGSPSEAAAYCKKEDSRLAGPWEWGTAPDRRGKKSKTALAVEAVKSGDSLSKVAADHSIAWAHSYRGLTSLAYMLRPSPDWREITTTVLWGKTGTGKTRTAFESTGSAPKPYFVVMPATWWDGYEGQDSVIFDDFYGQIRLSDMLRYLDGYPLQLPVKGGFTHAQWTKVWITSNCEPSEWWKGSGVPEDAREALMRRINEVLHLE